jgi:hypothetical protein
VLEQLPDHLSMYLAEARPMGVDGERLIVAFSANLHMKQADKPANRDQIAAAIRAVTGRALRLAYELRGEEELEDAEEEPGMSDEELIQRFVREFDATVLDEEDPA